MRWQCDRPILMALQVICSAALLNAIIGLKPVAATEHIIEIQAFKYVPDRLTVSPGDTITWINRDLAPHTATAMDRSWDTKRLKKGERMSIVITKTTKLAYFCRFHPHMKARLVRNPD